MAIREIVSIDRELCNGCEECIPNCHEGALQMIDGKATLVSELLCDGLGACIGHCPVGAITIERREAAPYSETLAIQSMIPMGRNVIKAHLTHLLEHKQQVYFDEGKNYLLQQAAEIPWDVKALLSEVQVLAHPLLGARKPVLNQKPTILNQSQGGGCMSKQSFQFEAPARKQEQKIEQASELRQWPVQMHLINPNAAYFKHSDLLLAADCVGYALGNFHSTWLKDKSLCIACPKLDSNTGSYIDKLTQLIDHAEIASLTLMVMEVPCCSGLAKMVEVALAQSKREIPWKVAMVGIKGEILSVTQQN